MKQVYDKIGDVEQLFRTTFDNGWSVSVIYDEHNTDYTYQLQSSFGEFTHYEQSFSAKEIFKLIAEIQNYDMDE